MIAAATNRARSFMSRVLCLAVVGIEAVCFDRGLARCNPRSERHLRVVPTTKEKSSRIRSLLSFASPQFSRLIP